LPIRASKRDVVCIDWDERSIRVVESGFSRTGPTVRRAVHVSVPQGLDVRDPTAMGDFVRRTLGEHRIRTRRAIVDVPRQDAVLNRLSLPAGTMDELAAMVHLQIAKELPFSKEQAVIDFAVVPKVGATVWDVWVAAIRINVVEYYRQVFTAAGLTLERIGLRPYANLRALQAMGATEGRVVMVDMGPAMTEINIVRDGELKYTRAASVAVPIVVPASDPAEGREGQVRLPQSGPPGASGTIEPDPFWPMDNLLIEVNRTIAAYRATDMGATIDRIVLAGAAGVSDRLLQAFQDRFNIPTDVFSVPESIRRRAELPGANASPFSACVGLILNQVGETTQSFDFLHVKEPQAEHRQRVKRRPVVAATGAMFVLAGGVAAYQPILMKNRDIETVRKQIQTINGNTRIRDEALKKVADLQKWQDGDVVWMDHLKKLVEAFPSNKDCFINKLEVNSSRGTISISLFAADKLVSKKLVARITALTDEKKRPLYDAVVGTKATDTSKVQDYPTTDEVTVTVLSLVKKKGK
jgi:type IV pilus assembly protein PilM